jgi:hypothetical protein
VPRALMAVSGRSRILQLASAPVKLLPMAAD